MKTLLKKVALLSALMISFGLILLFVGLFLGGGMDLRSQAKLSIQQASTTFQSSIKLFPVAKTFFNIDKFGFDQEEKKLMVEINKNYEAHSGDYYEHGISGASEIKNLQICDFNGILEISESKDDSFGIESVYCGDYQFYIEDDTFYLAVFPSFKRRKPGQEPKLVLFVPSNMEYEEVYLYFQGKRAEVNAPLKGKEGYFLFPSGKTNKCSKLQFDNLRILSGASKTEINTLNAKDLSVDVGVGTISFNSSSVKNILANIGSGGLDFDGDISGNAELSCGMGKVNVTTIRHRNYYNYDINGSSFLVDTQDPGKRNIYMTNFEDNYSPNTAKLTSAYGKIIWNFNR